MSLHRIFILALIIFFAVFVAQNAMTVEVRLLFWHLEASRAIVLLITFIIGMGAGALMVLRPKKAKQTKNSAVQSNP